MADPVNNVAALYYPPRGANLAGLAGVQPLNCTIVSVQVISTGSLVDAFVRAKAGTGPYTAWVAERVPYVDSDTDPAKVPLRGGYVAPVGFVIPAAPVVAPVDGSTAGEVLLPGQVLWVSPNELPTTTALTSPVTLPLS